MTLQSLSNSGFGALAPASQVAGGRRERKLQDTKSHIGDIAWGLFDSLGYENVTMEMIAETADVAKGTLYKHYPAKEALIQHRIDQICLERQESMTAAVLGLPSSVKRFEYLFQEIEPYLDGMRSYVFPYLLYMCSPNNGTRAPSIFESSLVHLLRLGQLTGDIVTDMPAERMAEYLSFVRLVALMRWVQDPDSSLRDVTNEMLKLFLNGVAKKG